MTNIVAFVLEPVERLLCAVGAISGDGKVFAKVRVGTASARELRLREGNVRLGVGDVTLEGIHVI